jgi:hypothetical protein
MSQILKLIDDIIMVSQSSITQVFWNSRIKPSHTFLSQVLPENTEKYRLSLFCNLLSQISPKKGGDTDFESAEFFRHFIMTVSNLSSVEWKCPEKCALLVIWEKPMRGAFINPIHFDTEFNHNGLIYVLGHRSLVSSFETIGSKTLGFSQLSMRDCNPPSREEGQRGTRIYMAPF